MTDEENFTEYTAHFTSLSNDPYFSWLKYFMDYYMIKEVAIDFITWMLLLFGCFCHFTNKNLKKI